MTSRITKTGVKTVHQLAADLQYPGMPEEVDKLGCTLQNWQEQISNRHRAPVTDAPTEAADDLMKRIKRAAFGLTDLRQLQNPYPAIRQKTQLDTIAPT